MASALSRQAILATYLPALVLALGTGIALPALPGLARSFDVSFGLASGVITSFLLGNLAGTVPSGWLIDRFGRRPVMIGGPLLTAAVALLVARSHSFPELLALRFLNGWAAQMWLMGRLAAISHSAAAGARGRLISWMFAMDATGNLAGPIAGGFIAAAWGLRAPFFVYALLALLTVLPTLLAEDTPRAEHGAERAAAQASAPTWSQLVLPNLGYFGICLFAGIARGPLQADLLHLYAGFAYHLGPKQIGLLATSAALVGWPLAILAGWMLDHLGRKPTMLPSFAGVTLSMAALGLCALFHLSLAWYVALFLLCVACHALTGGSIQTIGADAAPAEARGTFLGLWRFTGQGGTALSPVAFAFLADRVNYASSFLFTAASAAIVTLLVARYIRETG